MFSYVCWTVPKNVPVNQLFGVRTGMGMVFWCLIGRRLVGLGVRWWVSFLSSRFFSFESLDAKWWYYFLVPWWAEVHISPTSPSPQMFPTNGSHQVHLPSPSLRHVFIPMPAYFWQRCYPTSWTRYVSTPVIIAGLSAIPPATGINYSSRRSQQTPSSPPLTPPLPSWRVETQIHIHRLGCVKTRLNDNNHVPVLPARKHEVVIFFTNVVGFVTWILYH